MERLRWIAEPRASANGDAMTDLFPLDGDFGGASGSMPMDDDFGLTSDDRSVVRAPIMILLGAYLAAALALVCFVPGSSVFNVVGYVIGSVGVAGLVVWYRSVDRRRRRSPRYVFFRNGRIPASVPLLIGILTAAGHAYFLAQYKSLA